MTRLLGVDLSDHTAGEPYRDGSIRVRLFPSADSVPRVSGGDLRVSPIYRLDEGDWLPEESDLTQVLFLVLDEPFQTIARLPRLRQAHAGTSHWYSCGWASVVVLTDDDKYVAELLSLLDGDLIGHEAWQLWNGRITDTDHELRTSVQVPPEISEWLGEFPPLEALPPDMMAGFQEFFRAFDRLVALRRLYEPETILHAGPFLQSVQEIASELRYLHDLQGPVPEGLSGFPPDYLKDNAMVREQLRLQRTTRVLQVNSALSYVVSQGFAGTLPILHQECLVRHHSLLGIGTAIRGLARMTRHHETVFDQYPVDQVLEEFGDRREAINNYQSLNDYKPETWVTSGPEEWFKDLGSQDKSVAKLAYFSGRLGFRETEYTLSAAVQSILWGASMRWNILTLSHELLHAHVRDILTVVFGHAEGQLPEEVREGYYASLEESWRKPGKKESLLESIRNAILTYVCNCEEFGSLTRLPHELEGGTRQRRPTRLLVPDELWELWEDEFQNINEVLVHTLDFLYFFRGRERVYIEVLWRSWAEVPAVLGNVRQYVLRTLLAISAGQAGAPFDRFEISKEALRGRLQEMDGSPVYEEACRLLEGETLLWPFLGSIQLVDLAQYVFFSERLQGQLLGADDNIDADHEEGLHYLIEPGDFVDTTIDSPPALLFDLMRRQVYGWELGDDVDAVSTWMYIALAS